MSVWTDVWGRVVAAAESLRPRKSGPDASSAGGPAPSPSSAEPGASSSSSSSSSSSAGSSGSSSTGGASSTGSAAPVLDRISSSIGAAGKGLMSSSASMRYGGFKTKEERVKIQKRRESAFYEAELRKKSATVEADPE